MAQNFKNLGQNLTYTIPSATTITPGQLVKVGDFVGVAIGGGGAGNQIEIQHRGVFEVAKNAGVGEAMAQGQKLYFDPATGKATVDADDGATPTPAAHVELGWAWDSASGSRETIIVKLLG